MTNGNYAVTNNRNLPCEAIRELLQVQKPWHIHTKNHEGNGNAAFQSKKRCISIARHLNFTATLSWEVSITVTIQVLLPLHWCRNWSTGRMRLFWSPQGSHKQPHELSMQCNQLPIDSQSTKGILNKRASPLHAVSLNNQCDLGIHVYDQDIKS